MTLRWPEDEDEEEAVIGASARGVASTPSLNAPEDLAKFWHNGRISEATNRLLQYFNTLYVYKFH